MKSHKSLVTVAIATSFTLSACGGGGGGTTTTSSAPAITTSGSGTTASPVAIPASASASSASSAVTPVAATTTVTVDSLNGPRSFTVPLATQIGSAVETLPSDITGEVSLALWPIVAGAKAYEDVAGKLTAGQFPPGIWPVHFKYTYKVTTDRNDPTGYSSSSNFACSLDLVAGALVATVDGRTFSAPIDDSPTYTTDSFGNPVTGDGYRLFVGPTRTSSTYELATKRSITLLADTYTAYVDPTYGPTNAGPSVSLSTIYSGFIAGSPAGSTTMYVKSTDTKTGVFTSYRCKDQLV
jgi:hypothetical protein